MGVSDRVCVPLAVLGPLPSVRPSLVSENSFPMHSPLAIPQFCMLFQSTHEEIQGANASAKPAMSPLHRTVTAQIMGCCWAKHNGALEHIDVTRSIELLVL